MKLSIIDGDYLLYVSTHPNKVLDNEGNPVREGNKFIYETNTSIGDCISKVENFIVDILNKTEAEYYLGFLTGGSFRYKINSEYKANRKDRPKIKYLNTIKQYLIDEWGFYKHSELEADDLCNISAHKFKALTPIIVSNDKDMLNLQGKHYNPKRQEFVEVTEDQASVYFWTSMLTGDVVDNIKGCPGVGIKGAEKLLNGLTALNLSSVVFNKYVSVMGEKEGLKAFYENYQMLRILSENKVEIPEPVKYENQLKSEEI